MVINDALYVLQQYGRLLHLIDEHAFGMLAQESQGVMNGKVTNVDILHAVALVLREEVFEQCALSRLTRTRHRDD